MKGCKSNKDKQNNILTDNKSNVKHEYARNAS